MPIADTKENASGDFARVAYHEIKSRSTVEQGSLTIGDVNDLLDKLAGPNVKTSVEFHACARQLTMQCRCGCHSAYGE